MSGNIKVNLDDNNNYESLETGKELEHKHMVEVFMNEDIDEIYLIVGEQTLQEFDEKEVPYNYIQSVWTNKELMW
jgi:ribosomal protein L7Ae-like RNA K-turn-binding protein